MRVSLASFLPHRAASLMLAFVLIIPAGCKRSPSSQTASAATDCAPKPAIETETLEPPPVPPVVSWAPVLLPDEKVVDVADFAAVLTSRAVPPKEGESSSEESEFFVLTKTGERLGPWDEVKAFESHGDDSYHAWVHQKGERGYAALGVAADNQESYPLPRDPDSTPFREAPPIDGLEIANPAEGSTTVAWQGKPLGTWAEVEGAVLSPDKADLYFWARTEGRGWDVYRNGAAITQPDVFRKPGNSGSTGFVFGHQPGQVGFDEFNTDEKSPGKFGCWFVVGEKRRGPYMSLPGGGCSQWPEGAAFPTYASRGLGAWTVTTENREYASNGSIDSVFHDKASQEPVWTTCTRRAGVNEFDLFVGDRLVIRNHSMIQPVFSADGARFAFRAYYLPSSIYHMGSTEYVVLVPRSLKYGQQKQSAAPTPGAAAGDPPEQPKDPVVFMGTMHRFVPPPHAGPYGDIDDLKLSANGRAVAFTVINRGRHSWNEHRVFDGVDDCIGHLAPDGLTATVFKEGQVLRITP